jgi:predicted nucleic acid-binding protein
MKQDYYESDEFKTLRLLNQRTHDIIQTTQQIQDILDLLKNKHGKEYPKIDGCICNVYKQLSIVSLEASNLINIVSDLQSFLSPKAN